MLSQTEQLRNPDARVVLSSRCDTTLLDEYAKCVVGIMNGDSPRFQRKFWEITDRGADLWHFQQVTVSESQHYGGREKVILYNKAEGHLREEVAIRRRVLHDSDRRGGDAWGKRGVAVSSMGSLPVSLYTGDLFDGNTAVVIPNDPANLPAIWAFCRSAMFNESVREIDQAVKVTNATMTKVPFDLAYWQREAEDSYPCGLPEPYTENVTQWLFKGTVTPSTCPLQVATIRLLGYSWPDQDSDGFEKLLDDDGIVCIPAVRGERKASDRVRAVLAAAYDDEWSPAKQEELLASVGSGSKSIDEWLRDGFFEQHSKVFDNRPFMWHIWDGRKKDGFGALVNYHRLDAKLLDRLIYTYLGDWIKRQEQAVAQNESGADGRLLAAQQLQEKLKLIAEGEPPYDIFVRWKPIEEQAIGWNPDLNDGVRMNIRPFMEANILRKKPSSIKWKKDRGKEPKRPREQYPWFWGWDGKTKDFAGGREFTTDRFNDLHYTNAFKQAAREKVGVA